MSDENQATPTAEAPAAKKPSPEVRTVKMDDGSVVEFAGKRRMIKTDKIDPDTGLPVIRLDFENGEVRVFKVSSELLVKCAAHGAGQKLADEIAGVKDLDDAILAIDELMERLGKGEWTVKREANALAGASTLVQALMEAYGKTKEQIKEFLKDKTPAARQAISINPKIKPIIDRITAEKAARNSKINSDDLLAGLGE